MNAPWLTTLAPQPNADELALKDRFAEALLKAPNNPFHAACIVFGTDTGRALRASQEWTYDLYVLQRQADLLAEFGADEYLPTKAELARRVFTVGETATDNKDKLAAYKLYADIRNFIAKEQVNHNFTVNNNRVMVMRDFGTDEQWETKAIQQQTKLIEHSRD